MISKMADYYFLEGGGEMGKLIRAKDWSKTPLGEPKNWPQSLQTMVSVMLDNPFGMYIAWGKEYTQIYNDGYRPILGATKHPQALGISSRETFSEIWHIIESMFDGVMNGTPVGFPDFMLPLDRNGFIENCYFDFAYSPIRMENGEVGGVLVTVIETTAKKKAVEDLQESEERFRTMAEGTNIYVAVSDENSNASYFNKAWVELTGRPLDKLLEFGWLDLVHPEDKETYVNIYLEAFKKREPFTGEFRVLNTDGEYRWLLAQGPPRFRSDGSFAGYISSCVDITDQKNIELQLKENKEQLEFAIEAAQLGTWDYNPLSNTFSANSRLKEWFGIQEENETELTDVLNTIAESDRELVASAIQKALQYSSGGNYDVEYTIINPILKNEIIVHAKGSAWFNDDKIAYRLNGTLEDITCKTMARRKSQQLLSNMILEAPIGICLLDADTLICENVNEQFMEMADKHHEAIVGKHFWDSFAESKVDYEEALENVKTTGIPYYANEVGFKSIRNDKEENNYVTFVYAPVKDEKGNVTKIAIWVVDNTKQVLSREKVKESETNLKLMILQAPIAIAIFREENYVVEIANENALKLWGRTKEEIVGKSIFTTMPELLPQGIKELLDEVKNTGNRFAAPELPVQLLRNGSMEDVYINFSYEPLYDMDGKINGIMAIGFDVTLQVLARKKVEESEQNIRTLVESAPFPIGVYTGKEMRITLANQSILNAWGKGNDVIGKLYTDILPELQNQQIFEQVRGVYATGIPYHAKNQRVDIKINHILKPHYFNYSFTPLLDSAGKVYGVMNTAAEVTELHQAKQKVEESEKRFRDSVEQAPLGIAIFRGTDYIVEMANENYLLLIDKKEGEFIGKPLFKILPEVKSIVEPLFQEVITYEKAFYSADLPVMLKRKGKLEKAFFNLVYHPLKEDNGEISGIMVVATEVTETVKAKLLLEESEKNFRTMVMLSPIPMTILRGKDFIIESANTVMFKNIWHKKEVDVIGKSILEVFPELKKQKYPELLNKVFTTGKTHSEKESVAFVQGDDGTKKFYLDFEYAALFEPDGTVSGIMITVNDVTDKVEARIKLEDAEERSRLAAEATELATWELDLNTKNIIHSPRLAVIFGHDESALISHSQMRSQIHPEDIHIIVEKAFNEAMITGVYSYEARVVKLDKTICWIRTQGKVFFDKDNKPVKKLGTLRDITEEKKYQQVLQESESKFRLLADSMPQHIWTADPQGNINYYNQSVFDFSGLSLEKILNDGWLQIVHPDDRQKNIEKWTQSITTGKDFLLEHRFRRHDGQYRWQLSRAIPQKDENGIITMWVGSSTDIQDQKMFTDELEKQVSQRTSELNQKNIDLEKMNKELQSFTYISSHDLQEPLRKIQTFASQIIERESKNLSENGKDKFQRMQNAAFRMQTLIQDLLAYSRTSTQQRIFESTDLEAIIKEIKEDLKEELQQKDAFLEIGEMCDVKVIPFQFRQLLFNLISNSLKFASQDRAPHIKINCENINDVTLINLNLPKNNNYIHISVVDNGIGFNEEYSEKIFLVFQRLHSKEEYAGTGVGLAIVKKIVENHNGIILAKGKLNQGATFDIYIPS
ncbi:PAS domain S-box protein [Flavobacterium sp.]|uniref:PAS domain-containing sensor histidine kinase n=1 Tax=Flavobacterium sp. TaxID=239 RepID=UPI003C4C9834